MRVIRQLRDLLSLALVGLFLAINEIDRSRGCTRVEHVPQWRGKRDVSSRQARTCQRFLLSLFVFVSP